MLRSSTDLPNDQPPILTPSIEAREATAEEDVQHQGALREAIVQSFGHSSYASAHSTLPSTLRRSRRDSNDSDSKTPRVEASPRQSRQSDHNESPPPSSPCFIDNGNHALPGANRDGTNRFQSWSNGHDAVTELRVGLTQKQFFIPTYWLLEKSPHFVASLKETKRGEQALTSLPRPHLYPNLDAFSFSLFEHWLRGYSLDGPNGFFSMNHYLGLYVIAWKFGIESLCNSTMDMIREYYRENDMTAAPYRLEYLYKHTSRPCRMRDFLVTTAAYRALTAREKPTAVSSSMKTVLYKGGDLAVDYCLAMCSLARNNKQDVRRGNACDWHDHYQTSRANCRLPDLNNK